MQITIDGQRQSNLQGEGQTLNELVTRVKSVIEGSGRMIVAIECDGQLLAADQLDEALSGQADRYDRVDFQTAVPREVAAQALAATKDILDQIGPSTEQVAEQLGRSEIAEAMKTLGSLLGFWNDVYRGVYNTLRLLDIDPRSVELSTGTVAAKMKQLPGHLEQVKETLESRDYVQLADVFAYELSGLAGEWQALVGALMSRVNEDGDTDVGSDESSEAPIS